MGRFVAPRADFVQRGTHQGRDAFWPRMGDSHNGGFAECAQKSEEPTLPMPRKSPFLDMTNLYHTAGSANECAEMLINQPEAHALFEAQIAFRRGETTAQGVHTLTQSGDCTACDYTRTA